MAKNNHFPDDAFGGEDTDLFAATDNGDDEYDFDEHDPFNMNNNDNSNNDDEAADEEEDNGFGDDIQDAFGNDDRFAGDNDAFDDTGGDDDDDDDYDHEEEEDNELWEEVVDDDEDDEDEEIVEEEEVIDESVDDIVEQIDDGAAAAEGGRRPLNNFGRKSTTNSTNMDDQRNSMHSMGMSSVDNSASVDFDLGSYAEMSSHASDKIVPDDYEEACRTLLEIVQPNSDPDDIIRRCDLKALYSNLREQYRHTVRQNPEVATAVRSSNYVGDSPWDSGWNSNTEDDDAFFTGGPFPSSSAHSSSIDQHKANNIVDTKDQWPDDNGFDDDANADPFESTDDGNWDPTFEVANKLPPPKPSAGSNVESATNHTNTSTGSRETEGPVEVEKWLERNADDPDDYDYACRKLIRIIYGRDNPDHDPDTMMRRTSAPDLYRYLKNEYWFKVHTGELKEDMDESSHHFDNSSQNDKNANNGKDLSSPVESFGESARRLRDIDETELNSEVEVTLDGANKEPHPKEVKRTEDGNDLGGCGEDLTTVDSKQTNPQSMDINDKEKAVDVSSQASSSAAEGEEEHVKDEVNDASDVDGAESAELQAGESNIDVDDTSGDLPVIRSPTGDETNGFIGRSGEDVLSNDESKDNDKIQPESSNMIKSTSEGQEVDLLLELQRLKEEEAQLMEEEAKLRDAALRIQANQNAGQIIQPDATYEDHDNISEVQIVDERTTMLERSGLLIREMSAESIVETSEEELEVDSNTEQGDVDRDISTNDESVSSGKPERLEAKQDAGVIANHVDGDDADTDILRKERFERYTSEYNDMLDRQDNGESVDEDRLYLLELAVRQRLEEELTEDEIADLEEFDSFEKAAESSTNIRSNYQTEEDGDVIDDTPTLKDEKDCDVDAPDHEKGDLATEIDEMAWRKGKIETDLMDIVHQAEEEELGELVSTEAVVALKIAASRVALSKKYLDDGENKYVYFPSVAKCVYDFRLIEEAEKYYLDGSQDFPIEVSTALCTIASYRLKGDVNEVDENDEYIKEKTVGVQMDDISTTDSVETAMRKTMIEEEISTLILDAEQQELDSDFSPSLVSILKHAAFQVAYNRKYRDGDKFVYFPSVAKTIYTFALLDKAEELLEGTDVAEIPTEYVNALCTVAASYLTGNTKEVDPEDEIVKKTAVNVDIPNDSAHRVEDTEKMNGTSSMYNESGGNLSAGSNGNGAFDSSASEHEESTNSLKPDIYEDVDSKQHQDVAGETNMDDVDESCSESTSSELEIRKKMLSDDFCALIEQTEEKELEGKLDEAMVQALKSAAEKVCYVKKFFDVTTDGFLYYPSVAKSIRDYTLFELAGGDQTLPPDQVSALRAVASTLIKDTEPDESDEYVYNMTVDVELPATKETEKADTTVVKGDVLLSREDPVATDNRTPSSKENVDIFSPVEERNMNQGKLSESARCLQMVADDLAQLIQDTEDEELEEEFDDESVEVLKKAAAIVAYRRKFYSILDDEIIYYPSVARTVVDYSLIDAANNMYGDEDEEFPAYLTAALRAVAISKLEDDDLDYEYMDKLASPIEDGDETTSDHDITVQSLKDCSDEVDITSTTSIDNLQHKETSKSVHLGSSETALPATDVLGNHDSLLEMPFEIAEKSSLPEKQEDVVELSPCSHSRVQPSGDPTIANIPFHNSEIRQSPTSAVVQNQEETNEPCAPKITLEEIEMEEQRLREMAEILEFKRRQDKQRISEDAKTLEEMKNAFSSEVVKRGKALDEDVRQKERELEEEFSLLFEKWQGDCQKVDQALAELISRNKSELARIDTEINSIQTAMVSEKERIDSELLDIENQRLEDEQSFPQKNQALRAKLATARTNLEALKKSIEEEINPADQLDSEAKEEKGRNFFGFGTSKKKQQLEHEKLKQAKIMELRLREMELENEIKELISEEPKLREQAKIRERERVDRQTQLKKDSADLELSSQSVAGKLQKLAEERQQLEADFSEQEKALLVKKEDLQETRKDDETWLAAEKENLAAMLKHGRDELTNWANAQKGKQAKEEERLSSTALTLKEKWVKEEAAFAKDIDALEQRKAELGISSHQQAEGEEEDDDNDEEGGVVVADKTTPDHLVALNQPAADEVDSYSVRSNELFDPQTNVSLIPKPLLAAALKAKEEQVKMSQSLSQLEIFQSTKQQDDNKGIKDLSASVPDHLVAMNQPKSQHYERNSIRELELFDVCEERQVEEKPLLAAALRAKQQSQFGVSLSGLDMLKDSIIEETTSDFSKSVPIIMGPNSLDAQHQPEELSIQENSTELQSSVTQQPPGDKTPLSPALEPINNNKEQTEETSRVVKSSLSTQSVLPKIGVDMSALFQEAKSLSLKQMNDSFTPPQAHDDSTNENTSPAESASVGKNKDSSNKGRLSWWQGNGKDFVACQFDPSRKGDKAKLEESLSEHNRTVAENNAASVEFPFDVNIKQDMATRPKSIISADTTTPSSYMTPSNLDEKRRKAAEARVRALAVRTGGVHSSSPVDNKASVLLSPKDKFKHTQQQLQQRVDAGKFTPSPTSPSGSTRALEWQIAANQQPLLEIKERGSDVADNMQRSDHLAWWKKNGKRLVTELLGKTVEISHSADGKQDFREAEARRLAERTQRVRENRLAQESQETQRGLVVPLGPMADSGAALSTKFSATTFSMPNADEGTKLNHHPTLIYPMIRETNRLSGFIRRYENKLENVCKSLLSVVHEANNDEGAIIAKGLPLPEMIDYIQNADWFKGQSSAPDGQSRPQLIFSTRDSIQWQESKQKFLSEMSTEAEKMSDSKSYKITSVGRAFLQMDGPIQADVARFLAFLDRASTSGSGLESESDGLTPGDMRTRWSDIAQLSGDLQSQRICDNLDGLISFCLEAHLIQ